MSTVNRLVDELAEVLTETCCEALRAQGVHINHNSREYEELWLVMKTVATPKGPSR